MPQERIFIHVFRTPSREAKPRVPFQDYTFVASHEKRAPTVPGQLGDLVTTVPVAAKFRVALRASLIKEGKKPLTLATIGCGLFNHESGGTLAHFRSIKPITELHPNKRDIFETPGLTHYFHLLTANAMPADITHLRASRELASQRELQIFKEAELEPGTTYPREKWIKSMTKGITKAK